MPRSLKNPNAPPYNKMITIMRSYDDYRRKTERTIPVIELTQVK
jgi:hypothetical protein